jgi:UDP-N-acetylglucosamine--N-acetylmuramyl-(pentapeptide) pyrophosphoryl-undecaprenol N-acetylglucosamine transferase
MTDERGRSQSRLRHGLLAGGGSGGHVFPALAVGEELARRGWRVSFAGDPGGMERRLVEARGLAFVPLAARPVVGRGPLARVSALATLARSARAARRWIEAESVDVVVGTGGYASAPGVLGARLARRPALLVEPNARPGAANRWLSRVAAREAAVADAAAGRRLGCRTTVTGVPVRPAFFAVPPLEPGGAPHLLVLGGSQGSKRLNRLLPPAVAAARAALPGLTVLHQCGARWVEEAAALWRAAGLGAPEVEVAPFLDDVPGALAAAALVVSRAGAITLAEIAAAGRPAVLVPLEPAGGHQVANARHAEGAGGARVLLERDAVPERLAELLAELLGAGEVLADMGARARRLARPDAAAAIADRVEALAELTTPAVRSAAGPGGAR